MNSYGCNKINEDYAPNVFLEENIKKDRENFVFPTNYRYGYTYVPIQRLSEVFAPEVALAKGTLFPELVDEYYQNQSIKMIEYLRNYRVERS